MPTSADKMASAGKTEQAEIVALFPGKDGFHPGPVFGSFRSNYL
jgi:hypothetical protein